MAEARPFSKSVPSGAGPRPRYSSRDAAAAGGLAGRAAALLGGRLDILVNSAAIMVQQAVPEVTAESWDRTLNLNLRAPFFVTQGALPFLRKSRGRW